MTNPENKVKAPTDYKHVIYDADGKPVHGSETGREPEYVEEETFKADKLDNGRSKIARKYENIKLDDLAEDYYLFTFAPVYFTVPAGIDFIYQFSKDLLVDADKSLITYIAREPLFSGLGKWGSVVQGVPNDYGDLLRTWAHQLVFTDVTGKQRKYWRVNCSNVGVLTPGHFSETAPVDIYTPSGLDRSIKVTRLPGNKYGFTAVTPEDWVLEEASRYFIKVVN